MLHLKLLLEAVVEVETVYTSNSNGISSRAPCALQNFLWEIIIGSELFEVVLGDMLYCCFSVEVKFELIVLFSLRVRHMEVWVKESSDKVIACGWYTDAELVEDALIFV